MVEHDLRGLRPTPLASYLAGLGLARVLGEQADAGVRVRWTPQSLAVDTTVEDLAGWLVDGYVPTPVLSPWNEGSGFGAKDKTPRDTLAALLALADARLDGYRGAVEVAARVGARFRAEGWAKERAVREYRNRCPEVVLPWVDATVVLADGGPSYPPLLGTGGNDGRFDFSTNVHQRLLEILPVRHRARSLRLVGDLIGGEHTEALQPAAVGQFDPAAAGGKGSSPFGEAGSLVNPWRFVLMIEGALLFAAGVARRHAHAASRAAMPFTVTSVPHGAPGGAAGEDSRGELWAPLWHRPFGLSEIRQLFTEARAVWQGRPAVRAVEFYEAVVSRGVAQGVDAFQRYGIHKRNGLAFVAVPLDRVVAQPRPVVRLAAALEPWVTRIPRTAPAGVRAAVRRFEAAQVTFAKTGSGSALVDLLASHTDLQVAASRCGKLRTDLPPPVPPPAKDFVATLAELESPELRVAVGVASCTTRPVGQPGRGMRELLLPVDLDTSPRTRSGARLWRDAAVVPGYRIRPLPDVLTDVLAWRCRTAPEEVDQNWRGLPTFRAGAPVPAADLHAWASNALDNALIDRYLAALLALDWSTTPPPEWARPARVVPVATLALLHCLAAGIRAADGQPQQALDPGWVALLRAGHTHRVHAAATARLRQAGWHAPPVDQADRDRHTRGRGVDGRALAAATVPRCHGARDQLRLFATAPSRPESI